LDSEKSGLSNGCFGLLIGRVLDFQVRYAEWPCNLENLDQKNILFPPKKSLVSQAHPTFPKLALAPSVLICLRLFIYHWMQKT
jgi:hypothetical protein